MGSKGSKQSLQTEKDKVDILENSNQQQILEEIPESYIELPKKCLSQIESTSDAVEGSLNQDMSNIMQAPLDKMTSSEINQIVNNEIDIEDRIKESESKIISEYKSQISQQSQIITERICQTEEKLASLEVELHGKHESFMNESTQQIQQIAKTTQEQNQIMYDQIIEDIQEQITNEAKPTADNITKLQANFKNQANKLQLLEKALKDFLISQIKDTQENKIQHQFQETIKNLEAKVISIIDRQTQSIQAAYQAKNSESQELRKQILEVKAELARLEKKVSQVQSSNDSKEFQANEDSAKKPQLNITKASPKTEQINSNKLETSNQKSSIISECNQEQEEQEDISLNNLPSKIKPISKNSQIKENLQLSSKLAQNSSSDLAKTKNNNTCSNIILEEITPINKKQESSDTDNALKMLLLKQDSIKQLILPSGATPSSSVSGASRKANSPITSEESFSSKVEIKKSKRNTRSKLE